MKKMTKAGIQMQSKMPLVPSGTRSAIEGIVLSREGQMIGLIEEVGGFLDISDKHVMISVGDVSLVAVNDQNYAYVTRLNEEGLEAFEGIDVSSWE